MAATGTIAPAAFDYGTLDRETRQVMREAAAEIRDRIGRTVQASVEIGQRLIRVRARLGAAGGGTFVAWIELEFDWGRSMAYRFTAVAEKFGDRVSQIGTIGTSALYLLAAPSTPDDVREQFVAAAAEGEPVTHAAVRRAIDQAREPEPPPPPPAPQARSRKPKPKPQRVDARRVAPGADADVERVEPAEGVTDEVGTPVTSPDMRAAFAARDAFDKALQDTAGVWRQMKALGLDFAGGREAYRQLYGLIKFRRPYALCPFHADDALARRDCLCCKGLGWVSRIVYEQNLEAAKGRKGGRR